MNSYFTKIKNYNQDKFYWKLFMNLIDKYHELNHPNKKKNETKKR